MLSSFLISVGYFAILLLFGYVVAVCILRIKNSIALSGMVCVFGTASYIVLVNALGYFMPIQSIFWIVLCILLLASVFILLREWMQQRITVPFYSCETPPRMIAGIFVLIILIAGFASARDPGSDYLYPMHLPVPAMIMEGHFPIMEVVNPWVKFAYHYGPALFAASISFLTGLSIMHAYAFQPIINIAGIVLFGGALGWELARSWRMALLSGALALGGAGFMWFNGVLFLRDLWNVYALHLPIDPPSETMFRYVTYAIRSTHSNALLMTLGHRPIAMGTPFFFGLLYTLYELLYRSNKENILQWAFVFTIFGAALALCLETTLVALIGALGIYVVLLLVSTWSGDEYVPSWKRTTVLLMYAIIPMLLLSLAQGGVLTSTISLQGDTRPSTFAFGFDGAIHYGHPTDTIALWEWRFVRDFGLPILLLPFVTVYFWRRRKKSYFPVLLCIIALVHFLIPLFVRYVPRENEMNRFFFIAISLGALLAGLWIWETCFQSTGTSSRKTRFLQILGSVAIVSMLLSSTLHVPIRLFFPTLNIEKVPLFPAMPSITPAEQSTYEWVRTNTASHDYFLVNGMEAEEIMLDRTKFITYARRFVISLWHNSDPAVTNTVFIKDVEDHCIPDAISNLQIRYLAVMTQAHVDWFVSTCDRVHWKLRYDGAEEGKEYPRIYEFVYADNPIE